MDTAIPASAPAVRDTPVPSIGAAILRDIARGGIAGLVVGLVVGGIGGRVVMRLAALLVPDATGLRTENGNRIGDITADGTLALLLFGGLAVAILMGVIWVVISPWLPASVGTRALAAIPVAIAFGSPFLIEARNPDFLILGRDPVVVAMLVVLVALTAPAMALTDAWLDRHLPTPAGIASIPGVVYLVLTAIGGLLGTVVLIGVSGELSLALGATIVLTGLCTLGWWVQRLGGMAAPSRSLVLTARAILTAGTAVGLYLLLPEVQGALGID
jgi:hypothetical protein